jgi:hypothetical protein
MKKKIKTYGRLIRRELTLKKLAKASKEVMRS